MAKTDAQYQAEVVARLQEATVFHVALSEDLAFLRLVRATAATRIAELRAWEEVVERLRQGVLL